MDWLDLLAVHGTLKSLLQHHSSKALIIQHSAFFIAQLSYPYMTTGKTKALTIETFAGKVMSLLFNTIQQINSIAKFKITPNQHFLFNHTVKKKKKENHTVIILYRRKQNSTIWKSSCQIDFINRKTDFALPHTFTLT